MSSSQSQHSEEMKRKRQESSYVKLNKLRNEAALCDVILKTADGDDGIYAHRCVIASNSEYFERMFIGAEDEGKSTIRVEGINDDVLRRLIDFMYTGELSTVNADNVEGMLDGAELLQLNDVRDACVEFYTKTMDDENCLTVKNIADSKAMTDLSEKCLNYAAKRLASVRDCAAFLDADVTQITRLIENDEARRTDEDGNVDGTKIYEAILKWVKHDESNREHLLPELLRTIQLTSIPHDYFYRTIVTEPLVASNPKCAEWISNAFGYFDSTTYGGASSVQSTVAEPTTKRPKKRRGGLPRVKCTEPKTPCSGKIAIDLGAILSNDFQTIEWTLLMNEDNFLKEWDEEWEDVNGPWTEEYKHDW